MDDRMMFVVFTTLLLVAMVHQDTKREMTEMMEQAGSVPDTVFVVAVPDTLPPAITLPDSGGVSQ